MIDRAAWLEGRKAYIGASEIAALCGLGSRKPIQIYEAKLGLVDEAENDDPLSIFGRDFEPILWSKFEAMTKFKTEPAGTVWHSVYPQVACNPDRFIVGEDAVCEGKTFGFQAADEWGQPNSDEVPLKYRVQALVQLECTEKARCEFIAFRRETAEYTLYYVNRNRKIGMALCQRGQEFMERNVAKRIPPQPDESDAYRDYLSRAFPKTNKEKVPATAEQDAKIERAMYLVKVIDPLETELKTIKNELRAEIGEAYKLESMSGTVTYGEDGRGGRRLTLPKGT